MTRGERHRRGVAVHEAGHALLCHVLDVAVESVTIEWEGTTHGALVYEGTPPPESFVQILLAGEAAVARADQLEWIGHATAGAELQDEPDSVRVVSDGENIAAALAQFHPGDEEAQQRTLASARRRVDEAVERHWTQILRVAEALLRETTLGGDDVRRILETEP